MERTLVFHKTIRNVPDFSVDAVIASLRKRQDWLRHVSQDTLIEFFDRLVVHWETSGLVKKNLYLKNLTDFLRRNNLETVLTVALHQNRKALDGFVDIGDSKMMFLAQPRGLTVHWLAGNVTVLGMFSIILALITKNVCLVKASQRGYDELITLLDTFRMVHTDKLDGEDLASAVAVVIVDRHDAITHRALSLQADVRIAWGGKEAVETIMGLEKRLGCEDIIFGPKYSYALIDKESLRADMKGLAGKLAVDVSAFDQYACSSPHTVFVQEFKTGDAIAFAEELSHQMAFVNRVILPKGSVDSAKAIEIVAARATFAIQGRVWNSPGTEWTVAYSEEPGLAQGCFSRVIVVKPIVDLTALREMNDRRMQTLGVAMTIENKRKYLPEITAHGIDRCPDLGYMTFYESPWDGMFVVDRLVRWVSTRKTI